MYTIDQNVVGEVCPNNVTWFCACLCRNEDTVNYVCITCSLLQPFSANISKSTTVIIFCFQEIFPSIVHILKMHLVLIYQQPIVLFSISCRPFGTKSCMYLCLPTGSFSTVAEMYTLKTSKKWPWPYLRSEQCFSLSHVINWSDG